MATTDLSFLGEEDVWRTFWQKYRANPSGWRIHLGASEKGYPELIISSDNEFWLLKRESFFTGKPGLAVRVEEPFRLDKRLPEFGLRSLPTSTLTKLRAAAKRQTDPAEAYRILLEVLSKPPVAPGRPGPNPLLQGPIVHMGGPLPVLSESQAILNRRLEAELDKWKRRANYLG